ncbi:hypothetical protein AVEN_109322-1 [Araneus ventricosus]|uniref:Uncharacterized protein n=1 Tax=Araneus ventricosus TaxID=182803 RepID=A0A4Y2D4Q0_ARAVE|nr:hypothetical protein AVEN_109322-1 [Araneus ventricosus]
MMTIASVIIGRSYGNREPTSIFWILDFIVENGGLVVRSQLWGRKVPGSKLDFVEDPACMGPVAPQIIRTGQTSSRWCGAEAWRGDTSSGVVI